MSTFKSKGSVLSLTISAALTPIAQVLSLDVGPVESETYEADYLDNPVAGIPYATTGRVEPGKISGEFFLDLSNASHAGFMGLVNAPALSAGQLSLSGSSSSTRSGLMTFTAAGYGAQITAALKDGVKAKLDIKLSSSVTFST